MKTFDAIYDPSKNKGIYGLSLVENPAMQGNFIALADEDLQLKEVGQRILMGLIMRPNKLIPRKGIDGADDFNIVFSTETVKHLAHDFLRNSHQRNSSIEHATKIDGVSIVELWIVDDADKDKANANGLKPQVGDCFGCMKIDNEEVWLHYVETGKVKGFSIDAMVSLNEIINPNKNMSMDIAKAIKDGFDAFLASTKPPIELKLGSVNSADGSVVIEFEGETPSKGAKVWVSDPAGLQVPLPIGEYELADGAGVLVVTETGFISEVKEVVAPAVMAEPTGDVSTAVSEAIKSIMIKYSTENDAKFLALENKNIELSALNVELSNKIVALAKSPAQEPIVATPTARKGKFHELLNI